MSDEKSEAGIAAALASREGAQTDAQTTLDDDSITAGQLQTLFVENEEQEQGQPEEPQEETSPEAKLAETDSAAESEEPSLLAKLLPDATKEDLAQLASELGGRLGDDLGKLRAENRDLRATLDTELQKRSSLQADIGENPYSSIDNADDLKKTYQDAVAAIREGERTLRRNPHAMPDDPIDFNGKQLTKSELEDLVYNAKDARDTYLPAREQELRELEQSQAQRSHWDQKADSEHEWLKEDSPLKQRFDEILEATEAQIKQGIVPPHLKFALANAAAWETREKSPAGPAKVKPTPKVPGSPSSSAASSSRPEIGGEKVVQAAENQFMSSGSSRDFAKFLAAKSNKRP